jgi:hypothetical protein
MTQFAPFPMQSNQTAGPSTPRSMDLDMLLATLSALSPAIMVEALLDRMERRT